MSEDTNAESTAEGVVVPSIDAASSVACLRSLGRRGIPTVVVSEHETTPALGSRYCTEKLATPDPAVDLEGYAEALLALAARDDVRTVIPVREEDVYVLAKHKATFADRVGTPWPSLDALRRVQDRVELFDAAAAAGVAAPETAPFDDWTDWDREVIVKPRYTVHASEYRDDVTESYAQSESTRFLAPNREPDRDELVAEMGHVPLVQAFVPDSDEYAFFALYDEGEAVATFQHRQRRGFKYSGGPSAYRESVDIPALDAAGRRLLDHLDWHGLAMVEFLRDPATGEFELMEVNPRFWTSLPFTVQAGVDFPYYYYRQAGGEPPASEPDYTVGIGGHLLRGELLYLHSVLFEDYPLVERPSFAGAFSEIVTSVGRQPRFDYLDRDDLGPFVRDARNTVARCSTGWGIPRPSSNA